MESRLAALAAALLLCPATCLGVDLQIYFSALQRVLASQVFTAEGKLYVRGGDLKNKCDFAYLENPAISANGARLAIKTRFSGKTARNFFGKCVGMGDSFDLQIAAVPYYRSGSIALKDVKVDTPGRDGYYIRRVRAAITESLARQFAYGVAADAKRVLEQKRDPNYVQELRQFEITGIRVTPDSVVVSVSFELAVR